jgi:hypothetical protein
MDDKKMNNGRSLCSTLDNSVTPWPHQSRGGIYCAGLLPKYSGNSLVFAEKEIALLRQGLHFVTQQYVAVLLPSYGMDSRSKFGRWRQFPSELYSSVLPPRVYWRAVGGCYCDGETLAGGGPIRVVREAYKGVYTSPP